MREMHVEISDEARKREHYVMEWATKEGRQQSVKCIPTPLLSRDSPTHIDD